MYLPCLGLKADKKPRLYRLTCTLRLRDLFVSSQWVLFHFLIYCHLSTIVDLSWFWDCKEFTVKGLFRTSKIRRKFLLAWKYHFRHCNGGYHGRLFNKQTFRFLLVSNKKMKTFQFLCPHFLAPFPKELEKDILTWLKRRWNSSSKNIDHLVAKHFPLFYPKTKTTFA